MTKNFTNGGKVTDPLSVQEIREQGVAYKVRGFELVAKKFRKHPEQVPVIPKRKTISSAGYDFTALETVTIKPGEEHTFATDIKAYMRPDEFLVMNVRSSIGYKKHCRLINTQGWIDSDFYSNPENDGNIGICLHNFGKEPVTITMGERIAQGVFTSYKVKDLDEKDHKEVRTGGIGSTGEK